MAEEQRDVIEFLKDPSSYGEGVDRVDIVETHASLVFIAGDRAYKLKRAVRYPYLDFSTAQLRQHACEVELALNRRTAPALYLEVRGLFRGSEGSVSFLPSGRAVDWVVVMRRFDQALLFDRLAASGRLDTRLLDRLADQIALFHADAERHCDRGGAAEMAELAETQHRCLTEARQAGFALHRVDEILGKWRVRVTEVAGLLDRRRAAGKVRHCHGDLHLRNICLFDGQPTLFDCLEFSEALASIDVLYDLAFLVMDLEYRTLAPLANRVLNRYLDRTSEDDGLAALPFFLSLRAAIRAHVIASAMERTAGGHAEEMGSDARRYLDLAHCFLDRASIQLIAIGGLSGTGKSTLAAALAPELGRRPGARLLRSDVLRKLLHGVAPETQLPASAYTQEISDRVYDALCRKAEAALVAGYSVIVDAVSLKPVERRAFAKVARTAGVPFSGFWLEGATEALETRIRARCGDASDASPEILAEQMRHDPGPMDWMRIDASGGPGDCIAAVRRALAAV